MSDPTTEVHAPDSADETPEPAATPANGSQSLILTPPQPVEAVGPSRAADAVPVDDADRAKLDAMVDDYLSAVTSLDTHSQEFNDKVKDIAKLGDDDIRASSAVSNRLLEKPLAAMQQGGATEGSAVSKSLLSLRREVEALDPAKQGDLFSPKKLLGRLPFRGGDRLQAYFDKYRSSQHQIDAIITALYHGQEELQRDNASIEQEKVILWATMGRLRQYAYLMQHLDDALVARIAQVEAADPERAKVLKEDLLFPVRQKQQDLLTQLAVSVQGYLALDLIRRNNNELIKGVQRATTTTISALRTAVIVAQALADQKLVLDQITALNSTTSNLIESTSEMLHQQTGDIAKQASSSTVEVAKLQKAFDNVYATMDEIDTFKVAALDTMQQTVTALRTEIDRSQTYLDRSRANEGRDGGIDGLEKPGAG